MKAAMQLDHAKRPHNKIWLVNSSPERLDAMYVRLLGPRGDKVLPEELKWLAVTHKSFDQGRRGFNDRLAMMGKFAFTFGPLSADSAGRGSMEVLKRSDVLTQV
jgi:large subunit ribosomal protein L15